MTDCVIDDVIPAIRGPLFRDRPKTSRRPGMTLCLGHRIDDRTHDEDDVGRVIDDEFLIDDTFDQTFVRNRRRIDDAPEPELSL